MRPNSLTTHLRIVIESSAKGSLGKSLEDKLLIRKKL